MVRVIKPNTLEEIASYANQAIEAKMKYKYASKVAHVYSFVAESVTYYLMPLNQGKWQDTLEAARQALQGREVRFRDVLTADEVTETMLGNLFIADVNGRPNMSPEATGASESNFVEQDEQSSVEHVQMQLALF